MINPKNYHIELRDIQGKVILEDDVFFSKKEDAQIYLQEWANAFLCAFPEYETVTMVLSYNWGRS